MSARRMWPPTTIGTTTTRLTSTGPPTTARRGRSLRGDLPERAWWAHVIREDPKNRNLLYIGTEAGVWASWDGGVHWVSIARRPARRPRCATSRCIPRENDLLVATHGRGLYILDDLAPLQQLAAAQTADVTVFDIRPATRWNTWSRDGNLGQKSWAGENPPPGAMISYFLKDQPKGEVNVTITDKDNRVVRRLRRVADEPGVNRIAWDLRWDAAAGGEAIAGGGGRATEAIAAAAAAAAADTSLEAVRARRRTQATSDRDVGGGGGFFGASTPGVPVR